MLEKSVVKRRNAASVVAQRCQCSGTTLLTINFSISTSLNEIVDSIGNTSKKNQNNNCSTDSECNISRTTGSTWFRLLTIRYQWSCLLLLIEKTRSSVWIVVDRGSKLIGRIWIVRGYTNCEIKKIYKIKKYTK